MAFGQEGMALQLRLQLALAIGTAITEGRLVGPGPQPRAMWHDEERLAPRPQHAETFLQQVRRVLGGLEPVQQDQLVDMAGFQRPLRFLAEHRYVGHPRGPGHHALGAGHQPDHPLRIRQVGPQQRYRKAETGHGLALCLGPEPQHFAPDMGLRRTAQGRAVIEIAQVLYVQVHCKSPLSGFPWGHHNNEEANCHAPGHRHDPLPVR